MSYHLEKFYATNTILTNLHTDHLDWHRDIDEYYHAKLNLLARTKEVIIYPESVLTLFPELRDFPLQALTIPENISIDHELLALSPETFLDVSGIQLF